MADHLFHVGLSHGAFGKGCLGSTNTDALNNAETKTKIDRDLMGACKTSSTDESGVSSLHNTVVKIKFRSNSLICTCPKPIKNHIPSSNLARVIHVHEPNENGCAAAGDCIERLHGCPGCP